MKWVPATAADKAEVRRELENVMAAPAFANSKRYPAFLRFVVERVLDGRAEELKERTLGIEIFRRPPDYDTNNDTIVRVTAGEVRKRLMAYYLEAGAEHAIQITLPSGSYVTEFYRVSEPEAPTAADGTGEVTAIQADEMPVELAPRHSRRWPLYALAALILVAAIGGWWRWRPSSVDRYWKNLGSTAVILSPGTIYTSGSPATVQYGDSTHDSVWVSIESSTAMARLTRMLGTQKRDFAIQSSASLTLTDLRTHPVVLIGGFNNDWTMRLTDGLRFHLCPKNAGRYFMDRQNPATIWQSHSNAQERVLDYALVARFHDSLTDNVVFVVAGLNKGGTDAASEFVTTRRYLDLLEKELPHGWENRNLEVVLETHSVANKNSAPQIVATHVW